MNNNLLAKYLSGECSQDEVKLVEDWKLQNQDEFNEAKEAFNANLFYSNTFNSKTALNNIKQNRLKVKQRFLSKQQYLVLAASFVGILLLISGLWYDNSLKHEILNNNAGVSRVQLPDGSVIQLSQGSSIFYKESWFEGFNRNINLKGKAFFEISKNPEKKFVVKTNNLNVTVFGTQFTINQKANRTQFVLKEGKVKLESPAITNELIVDKPGQQIIIDNENIIKNNLIDASLYISWINEKIYFDNCSVEKVLQMLNDSYQIETKVSNPKLLDKQILGTAPSDDPELIVDALSLIIESDIEIVNHK